MDGCPALAGFSRGSRRSSSRKARVTLRRVARVGLPSSGSAEYRLPRFSPVSRARALRLCVPARCLRAARITTPSPTSSSVAAWRSPGASSAVLMWSDASNFRYFSAIRPSTRWPFSWPAVCLAAGCPCHRQATAIAYRVPSCAPHVRPLGNPWLGARKTPPRFRPRTAEPASPLGEGKNGVPLKRLTRHTRPSGLAKIHREREQEPSLSRGRGAFRKGLKCRTADRGGSGGDEPGDAERRWLSRKGAAAALPGLWVRIHEGSPLMLEP